MKAKLSTKYKVLGVLILFIIISTGVAYYLFQIQSVEPNSELLPDIEGNSLYTNINPGFEVSLGQKTRREKPTAVFSATNVKDDENIPTVQFEFSGITNVGEVDSHSWTEGSSPEIQESNDGNKLVYENVLEGVDVEYEILSGKGVKESIVINEFSGQEEFIFNFRTDGVRPIFEDGIWWFWDEDSDDKYFYFDPPYMEDANGERSENVEIGVEESSIKIIPDLGWLNDPNRKFPVVIDPTVLISVLNVHSHPQTGDNWIVEFETQGEYDLTITPGDQESIDDLDFVSLKCGAQELTPDIIDGDVIVYENWICEETAEINHFVNLGGNHTLKFEFGEQVDYAYNSTDSITDSFADESKIDSKTNLVVSGGQVRLTCLSNGSVCTSSGDCCSGICGTDSDGDGYFSQALGESGTCQSTSKPYTDCYDLNSNAKPGQTTYYTSDRGDGSYDYDCSGSTTRNPMYDCKDTLLNSSCTTSRPAGHTGYPGTIGFCGQKAYVYSCKSYTDAACSVSGSIATHNCYVDACKASGYSSWSTYAVMLSFTMPCR